MVYVRPSAPVVADVEVLLALLFMDALDDDREGGSVDANPLLLELPLLFEFV